MNHALEKLFEMLFFHYNVVNATTLIAAAFSYTKDKIKIMATYFVLYYFLYLTANAQCTTCLKYSLEFFFCKNIQMHGLILK